MWDSAQGMTSVGTARLSVRRSVLPGEDGSRSPLRHAHLLPDPSEGGDVGIVLSPPPLEEVGDLSQSAERLTCAGCVARGLLKSLSSEVGTVSVRIMVTLR